MGKYLDSLGLSHLIGLIKTALSGKQATLVSGTNIKTINNESLLGSGNISVGGGGNYLPLSGGTLTGELVIEDSEIDRSTTPSANQYHRLIELVDVNGDTVGYIQANHTTDGSVSFTLGTDNSDGTNYNQVILGHSVDDGAFVVISHPAQWRSALSVPSTSQVWNSTTSRTANTVLAAPNGSAGAASFRALVSDDIPSLAISKITNLQTTLNGKAASSHSHAISDINGIGELAGMDTITEDGTSRTKNTVLAAPNGSNGAASFRSLVLADLPSAVQNKLNSITSTQSEVIIESLNGLTRLYLTYNSSANAHNLRVDTRASTSDAWTTLYYPATQPITETTIANVMTQTSTQSTNNPITAAKYYKASNIVMVEITFKPAAARSAGAAISLGTIVSGKRPHFMASGGSDRIMGSITSAGVCNLYVRTALTANTAYTIGFTYTT